MASIDISCFGRIGRDAVVKDTKDGNRKLVTFSIACDNGKDYQTGQKKPATWVQCTMWRDADKLAIVPYLKQGQWLKVTGKVYPQAWTDKDGVLQTALGLEVWNLDFIGNSEAKTETAPAQTTAPQQLPATDHGDFSDDLPF